MRNSLCLLLLCLACAAAEPETSPVAPFLATVSDDPPAERQLRDTFKETLETQDVSEVTQSSASLDETGGRGGRSLQDGNPAFQESIHESKNNYFQLVMHTYDRNRALLPQVQRFVAGWMRIEAENETLRVAQLRMRNRLVNNRFVATYTNLRSGVSKIYYLDIDFSDGRSDRSRVPRVQTIDYLHAQNSNLDYLSMYDMTLEEDCRTIQQARHNPQEIQCNPWITRDGFVIPHVYRVVMRFRLGHRIVRRVGTFFVRSRIIGPEASPLTPTPINLPTTANVVRMITERVRAIPMFENKNLILDQLRQRNISNRIETFTSRIGNWEMRNRARLRRLEVRYQANLVRALRTDRNNKQRDNLNFDRTYGLMRRAAARVNAFNIRSAIRRTTRRLEDRQTIRAHRAKVRYYQREIALMQLMERLDHMRYLADKHLDDNFDHYYSAEYFGK